MKKLLLICAIAAVSSTFGALCKEVVDPCPPKEPEPEEPCGECSCDIFVPPALVVPQHILNVTHSLVTTCHSLDVEHILFTLPPIEPLFCNCNPPETPAPEEEKKCVIEPEPEGLCPRPTSKSAANLQSAFSNPIAAFTSAQLLNGICRTADGQLLGALELKIGKLGKSGSLKVSGKITCVNGKKLSARAVSASVGNDNSFACNLTFGGVVGTLPVKVSANVDVPLASTASSNGCTVQSCLLGGELRNGEVSFGFDGNPVLALPQGYSTLLDETAWEVVGDVSKGTTLKFAKAKAPKVVKAAEGFALAGLDAENVRGLKLRYSKKTGMLKGDYTIYASDFGNADSKPKIKKFKMKLGGFVWNGLGNGVAIAPDGSDAGIFVLQ